MAKEDGVSLGLDAAAIAFDILVPEEAVAAQAIGGVALASASVVNSSVHGDFPGIALAQTGKIIGLGKTMVTSGPAGQFFKRANPILLYGTAGYDAAHALKDYADCMAE